jgi:hypothetical protein
MRKIIFRRGLETNTPLLAVGEPGFSIDTGQLYIGGYENYGAENQQRVNILINTISGSSGLTEQQLDDAIEAALAGYATETYVNDAIGDIESPVSVDSNDNIVLTTEDTFIDDNDEEITVTKQWEFASDGTTYLSKNSFESTTYLSTPLNETDVSLEITAGRDIYLKTAGYDSEGGVSTSIAFKFDDEGAITFPNGTVQTSANILWSISASESSSYMFSGPGIVSGNTNNPVLYLQRGSTYTFVNTTGTNHPFAIRDAINGAAYTSGVSGSQTGTQTFTVPMDAPSTLYYQCTIHSAMGNTIVIDGPISGTWSIPTGTSTHSFTVDWNNTYVMWVRGNIPNGIITWNATVSVTNANVPVIGTQYAWNYNSGTTEAPVFVLALSEIPAQIIGTPGTISTLLPAVGTDANTFAFTISNSSGAAQTISYGYRKI